MEIVQYGLQDVDDSKFHGYTSLALVPSFDICSWEAMIPQRGWYRTDSCFNDVRMIGGGIWTYNLIRRIRFE